MGGLKWGDAQRGSFCRFLRPACARGRLYLWMRGPPDHPSSLPLRPHATPLLQLLRYDHQERLTAREAMEHPWLAPVRELAARRRAEEAGVAAAVLPPLDPSSSSSSAAAAAGAGVPRGET